MMSWCFATRSRSSNRRGFIGRIRVLLRQIPARAADHHAMSSTIKQWFLSFDPRFFILGVLVYTPIFHAQFWGGLCDEFLIPNPPPGEDDGCASIFADSYFYQVDMAFISVYVVIPGVMIGWGCLRGPFDCSEFDCGECECTADLVGLFSCNGILALFLFVWIWFIFGAYSQAINDDEGKWYKPHDKWNQRPGPPELELMHERVYRHEQGAGSHGTRARHSHAGTDEDLQKQMNSFLVSFTLGKCCFLVFDLPLSLYAIHYSKQNPKRRLRSCLGLEWCRRRLGWWNNRRTKKNTGAATTTPAPSVIPTALRSLHEQVSSSLRPAMSQQLPSEVLQYPDYWTSTQTALAQGVTAVVAEDDMVPAVQQLMSKTWTGKYTRDRKGSEVPTGCRVLSVLRIENPAAFEKLFRHKWDVRKFRKEDAGGWTGPNSWGAGGLDIPPFAVQGAGSFLRRLKRSFDTDVNEVYLFHGTNPESADKIARGDFRIDKAGQGMFGRGIYLAENSSKSDEYAREGAGVFAGQFAMLICRAVLGKVREEKDPGDYRGRVMDGNYGGSRGEYDSVCGDRKAAVGTYREFILYEEAAVSAEYIVLYRRVSSD